MVLDGELVILRSEAGSASTRYSNGSSPARPKPAAKRPRFRPPTPRSTCWQSRESPFRTQRWSVRRQRPEQLAGSWLPSLQLTPVTADIDEARDWFEVLPAAMGVEDIVAKGAASRYTPGRRDAWIKVNSVGVAVFDELTRGTFDQVSHGSRVG